MNIRKPLLALTAWVMLALTSACNSQTAGTSVSEPANSAEVVEPFRSHNLTLRGYNYTDFEIGSFEVNGQGGGGIPVSDETSGASHVCCFSVYSPMPEAFPITIKWNPIDDKWCEQTVMLEPPLPAKPENFEVHFYQDGHIEVAVTEGFDGPGARVKLPSKHRNSRHQDESQNVDNSSKFARCRIGYQ